MSASVGTSCAYLGGPLDIAFMGGPMDGRTETFPHAEIFVCIYATEADAAAGRGAHYEAARYGPDVDPWVYRYRPGDPPPSRELGGVGLRVVWADTEEVIPSETITGYQVGSRGCQTQFVRAVVIDGRTYDLEESVLDEDRVRTLRIRRPAVDVTACVKATK